MTTEAVAGDPAMVEGCRRPCRGFVAFLAIIARGDVIGGLARRPCSVVAAGTIGGHAGVVKLRAAPGRCRCVAILTIVARRNMVGGFARCLHAIVATETIARHAAMIEPGVSKS